MTRPSKAKDLERLAEIATLTNRETGIIAERRKIWKRRHDAGDVSDAELARISGVNRSDISKGLRVGEKAV